MILNILNADAFLADLQQEVVEVMHCEQDIDVDIYWPHIRNAIDSICNHHAPLKTHRLRSRTNSWMTKEIIDMMYKIDYLHKMASKQKDIALWEEYKKHRNMVVHEINNSKGFTIIMK